VEIVGLKEIGVTSKEIEELAGHRPVSAWVVKLVNDAIAIEREACAKLMDEMDLKDNLSNYYKVAANKIRARGNND
jgi:hypothetical protein